MTNKIPPGYKKTDIGIIPEDWEVKRLGEVFDIFAGGDVDKSKFSYVKTSIHKYPIYSNALENDGLYGYSSEYRFQENSITVTARGTLGFAIPRYEKFDAIIRLLVLRPKFDVDIKFISEYINERVEFSIESTGVPQLTAPQISKYQIPLPPLPEQRAIARILSDFDALIESLDRLIEKKKAIKKGAMQELLTGKKRLPGFKGKWVRKRLGEMAEIYQPETISQNKFKSGGKYLVYGANGVIGRYDKYNHETWQVIIACRGSTVGTVNRTENKVWITGNAMVINVEQNPAIDKSFLYYLLLNQDFSEIVSGSGQPQITRGPLSNFELFLPPTLAEQRAIAQILSDMDAEIEALEQKKKKYEMMKKGTMELLLTGKVRVKEENGKIEVIK